MTKFNANNKGYLNGYPLFLGEDLGIIDTINIQYPQLEDLYQKQVSQIWNENEIDLTQDKMDMLTVPKETVDLMVKTIMWQTLADSTASRSIIECLGDHITNSEMLNLATVQSFFECIHARTYSHIIKQTFTDPNEMITDLYSDMAVIKRSEIIVKSFNQLAELPKDASEDAKRKGIIRAMIALFALEAIAFMGSFAVTFAVTETKVFQGIGQLVTLICKDEVLHTRMDYAVLDILKKDPEWNMEIIMMSEDIKGILDSVVEQEVVWADYLFSEGRNVLGLSAELLKEYVYYMALPLYKFLGVDFDFPEIIKNPLPYMEKYVDSTKIMVAPQELQLTSYKIGAIKDDTDGLDLDFDM